MNEYTIFGIKIEELNQFIALVFKLGLAVGGLTILMYCWKIEYFPSDISLSEALLLLMIAIPFSALFGIYTISFVCFSYLIAFVFQFFSKKIHYMYKKNELKIRYRRPSILNYLFSLLFVGIAYKNLNTDIESIVMLILTSIIAGLTWSMYVDRKLIDDQFNDIREKSLNTIDRDLEIPKQRLHSKLLNQRSQLYHLLTIVFLAGINYSLWINTIDFPMKINNIQTGAESIHVQKPYDIYFTNKNVLCKKSVFGSDFVMIDSVNILFQGFGSKMVVEVTTKENDTTKVIIPNDKVHIP